MIASSTTIPMARINANKVSVLIVNPNGTKKINVPISDTGMANTGIKVARQFWRNKNTTITTKVSASKSVVVTSFIEVFTTETDSEGTEKSISLGKVFLNFSSSLLMSLKVSNALAPGA